MTPHFCRMPLVTYVIHAFAVASSKYAPNLENGLSHTPRAH